MIQVDYEDEFVLTQHFKLKEFINSSTANRLNIDNHPTYKAFINITALVVWVLEPLRELLGRPIVINSGYRCPELNKAVGGVSNSQHMKGEAADIRCTSKEDALSMLEDLEKSDINFDQAIVEHNADGVYWLHVSSKLVREKNRRKVIRDMLKK